MTLPKICYEIFVPSFSDSNDDGIGDLQGIINKIDYLIELGVEAVWLSPIFKSPSYHKYDVSDYYEIDPNFGDLQTFAKLIEVAHQKGLKVYLDLVINHTSSKHPWFRASSKGIPEYKNFYIWKTPEEIKSQGIEFRESSADSGVENPWHWSKNNSKEQYYGMFWSEMPDLNFLSDDTKKAVFDVAKHWLKVGVDGFRLDAAKHVYTWWEHKNSWEFWEEFRHEVNKINPDCYLLGEVWDSPHHVAPYFKGLTACFNFSLAEKFQKYLGQKLTSEELINFLHYQYREFSKVNPNFVDAIFLSNHDQKRIASCMNNDASLIKMMATILLTLPGQPYIYYGEEIGMKGEKPDNSLREAFIWGPRHEDRSRTNWQKPKYNTDSKTTPLSAQMKDQDSIYWHYRNLIYLRKNNAALCQITQPNIETIDLNDESLIAYKRPHLEGDVYVFHNIGNKTINFFESNFNFQNMHQIFGDNPSKLRPYQSLIFKI